MAIWEGSGNVIALDVLRALAREPESLDAFFTEVSLAEGAHPMFDAYLDGTRELLSEKPEPHLARWITERLALTLQASLMLRFSPSAVADAFTATRLGTQASQLYGSLPVGADLKAILDRA